MPRHELTEGARPASRSSPAARCAISGDARHVVAHAVELGRKPAEVVDGLELLAPAQHRQRGLPVGGSHQHRARLRQRGGDGLPGCAGAARIDRVHRRAVRQEQGGHAAHVSPTAPAGRADAGGSYFSRPSAFSASLHRRPRRDALLECDSAGHVREVDLVQARPVQQDEQVRVGDREILAGQVRLLGQRLRDQREAVAERLNGAFPHLGRRLRVPQRTEALVHFGADERQPLHQLPARGRAERGRDRARLRSAMYCRITLASDR